MVLIESVTLSNYLNLARSLVKIISVSDNHSACKSWCIYLGAEPTVRTASLTVLLLKCMLEVMGILLQNVHGRNSRESEEIWPNPLQLSKSESLFRAPYKAVTSIVHQINPTNLKLHQTNSMTSACWSCRAFVWLILLLYVGNTYFVYHIRPLTRPLTLSQQQ
jgi:hypothetical protein